MSEPLSDAAVAAAVAIPAEKQKTLGQLAALAKAQTDAERITSYYLLPQTQQNELRHQRFVKILEDKTFQIACEKAGVQPTRRQASKWVRKFGAAWTEYQK